MEMFYRKTSLIITTVVMVLVMLLMINGFEFGERQYFKAKVERSDIVGMSYKRSNLYLRIINTKGKAFYTNVTGPVLRKGEEVIVSCTKRIISGGLICRLEIFEPKQ
ncbi:hypothetical protein CW740_09210 [Kangiella profundi]|uniref:Uncharacterized protein n=1 Tax=Kangiella profundi TaxID=1561924 RepID=A0A2K9AD94_9GAMM|nr:hypothetical protein [Kangiella profundi]AUD79407.1 hypothetical protein CW740_09210 [Kangiella profundi]GGE98768.1 hypothetical protein GCM10011356_10700 [Kangiella profundi]